MRVSIVALRLSDKQKCQHGEQQECGKHADESLAGDEGSGHEIAQGKVLFLDQVLLIGIDVVADIGYAIAGSFVDQQT
ncbi:MAG: hypothetical protein KGQ89_09125, partial [Verrucomicrobia bacterium]|nr:hypothetical protein [Verrucomicrobiota bacterium]